jgi:hypothetical protein
MLAIIIILATLLAAATAFIFWLLKVLKNTLNMTDGLVQLLDGKTPKQLKTAYNNKYYPANAVIQIKYGCSSEGKIVDFSLYDKYKIVGFTILTKDQPQDYYGEIYNTLTEDEANELLEPILIKNVLVYEVQEGDWLWKKDS